MGLFVTDDMLAHLATSRKTRKMVTDMLAKGKWTDAQRNELLKMSVKLVTLENPVAKLLDSFYAGLALPWKFAEAVSATKALVVEVGLVQGRMVAMDQERMKAHGVGPIIPNLIKKYDADKPWPWWKWAVVGIGVWWGGKLAYQYLDEKTRIPMNRLPRYAGGRRKSRR